MIGIMFEQLRNRSGKVYDHMWAGQNLQTCGKKRGAENPHVCWDLKPLQVC